MMNMQKYGRLFWLLVSIILMPGCTYLAELGRATQPKPAVRLQTLRPWQCPLRFPTGPGETQQIAQLAAQLTQQRQGKDLIKTGRTLVTLGDSYRSLGSYGEAIKAYQEAIGLAEQAPSGRAAKGLKAGALAGWGYTLFELGQYNAAIEQFAASLALRQQLGTASTQILTLNNLGNAYAQMGDDAAAVKYYDKGLQQIPAQFQGKPNSLSIWLTVNRASTADTVGAYLAAVNQAIDLNDASRQLERSNYGALLNNLALAYRSVGDLEYADQYYQVAATALQTSTTHMSCEWRLRRNQAELLQAQGKTQEAIGLYEKATQLTDLVLQDQALTQEQRDSYRRMVEPLYREMAELLEKNGDAQKAQALKEKFTK